MIGFQTNANSPVDVLPGRNGGTFAAHTHEEVLGAAVGTLLLLKATTARDLAEFRAEFEGQNARWAARRRDESDLEAFQTLVEEAGDACSDRNARWQTVGALDMRFHCLVAEATHNTVRLGIMLGIADAMVRGLNVVTQQLVQRRGEIYKDIRRVAQAVSEEDVDAAQNVMSEHVRTWSDLRLHG